ncbi:LysR family transcriptional regulator [Phytomonospora endophytica]|uniref:DNA-binding transcriptional LysR family regulator n=1 Tax=Phytomonospora endophytica TaxID=714109 RepID=A0A841FQG0_9ACTN|nr:LysR family transcriptional regulator [Phytomonospora endophytica]MBB6038316.1 DNA-binding transcriptional LysR family regulator [Phytomonospora endophytica]GIG64247.1 transcriptional regulator [Phytomonospora endophytica]
MTTSELAPHELRVLVSVAEARGFGAGAARLGLTQSAVSHAVRTAERKLGVVLFTRGRQGAAPTEAGARAVARARHILRLLDTMGAEVHAAGGGEVTGTVRIAAFRSAAVHVLPGVLDRLAARHPGVSPQVNIVREVGPGTTGEVADGRADLAVATLNPDTYPIPKGLLSGKLFEERYLLVHPASAPDPRGLPLVDWAENCSSHTRGWWRDQDWMPTATVTAEDDGVVLSMVAAGMGMAVVPELSLLGAPGGIVTRDLGPDGPKRQVGYVVAPGMAQGAAVRELIRGLRETPVGV